MYAIMSGAVETHDESFSSSKRLHECLPHSGLSPLTGEVRKGEQLAKG